MGSKPMDSAPMDNTPTDNEPMGNKPLDSKPMDNTPTDNEPMDSKPVDEGRRLILASASPARLALLRGLGWDVRALPTGIDERLDGSLPGPAVEALARRKLEASLASNGEGAIPILACDTIIWFEGRAIGKPRSTEEARADLRSFSGRTHQVYTGYALWADGRISSGYDVASVAFREIGDEEIEECLRTGEHQGAAGAYRLQGFASRFVSAIEGDRATVVGVPVEKLGLQPRRRGAGA